MRYIVGIDEVGRGSLAGPVVVAAVSIPQGLRISFKEGGKLHDSKKLTPQKREQWFKYIKSRPEISFALARVYPRRIEKMNISKAANLAAFRAFDRLATNYSLPTTNFRIYLDGGLYLGNQDAYHNAKTVIKGDEKIGAIKLASIVAKVSRDRFMARLAKKYPHYGFEVHKGYATEFHLRAIRKSGPSEVHRLTFLKKRFSI